MKITFVGTSHGIPQADRYCSCYMIEIGKAIYFVRANDEFFRAKSNY